VKTNLNPISETRKSKNRKRQSQLFPIYSIMKTYSLPESIWYGVAATAGNACEGIEMKAL
jgi:hypothetical protein